MTKTANQKLLEAFINTPRREMEIRTALKAAGIALDPFYATALLSIAVDHFADHGPQFLALCEDLQAVARKALEMGALCPTCRAELEVVEGVQRPCEWCA